MLHELASSAAVEGVTDALEHQVAAAIQTASGGGAKKVTLRRGPLPVVPVPVVNSEQCSSSNCKLHHARTVVNHTQIIKCH